MSENQVTLLPMSSLAESPACRILVISSSLKQAVTFIHTILAAVEDDSLELNQDLHSTTIPWSIRNKYYTAQVHFEAHAISHWDAQIHAPAVPAIIFVWQGEPYKHNIERLSNELAGFDPEVLLAVRIQDSSPKMDMGDDDVEEDAATDEFLSSQGFEFVNVSSYHTTDFPDRNDNLLPGDDDHFYSDGISRLPRVIDALSTIMWPSMQSHDIPIRKKAVKIRKLLDWAQNSFDTTLPDSNTKNTTEMDDLERWLSDGVVHGDPWKDATETVTTSPIAMEDHVLTTRPFGFDDDFTVFVSASAIEGSTSDDVGVGGSGTGKRVEGELLLSGSSMSFHEDEDESRLSAGISGGHYTSLGSASDFGGSEDGDSNAQYKAMKAGEDDDDGLPTEEEIRATSARIFGMPLSKVEIATANAQTCDDIPSLSEPQNEVSEDEFNMSPFDLSRVLSTLEGMKAEIAGIADEGERRKAAARVALGLVHGLGEQ